jgi:predicted DNA-binding transcriptional regulator AlpA
MHDTPTSTLAPDRLRTIDEAAAMLGVTPRTIYRLMREAPDFPKPVRIGKRLRLRESELRRVLERGAAT